MLFHPHLDQEQGHKGVTMIDDRICIFYVADRVEQICKQQRQLIEKLRESMDTKELLKDTYDLHEAENFLTELNHNIGVNIRRQREDASEKAAMKMLKHYKSQMEIPKKKRGRPRSRP